MIEVPGYLLSSELGGEPRDIFRFRNNNFTRILDDEIIFSIVQALSAKRKVSIERKKKPPLIAIPLALETDFLYNRRYLIALKEVGRRFEPPRRLREVRLTLDVDGEKFFEARLRLDDPRKIYPLLWREGMEILAGADGLRERMRNDVSEALKNYADAV